MDICHESTKRTLAMKIGHEPTKPYRVKIAIQQFMSSKTAIWNNTDQKFNTINTIKENVIKWTSNWCCQSALFSSWHWQAAGFEPGVIHSMMAAGICNRLGGASNEVRKMSALSIISFPKLYFTLMPNLYFTLQLKIYFWFLLHNL